MEMRKKQPPNKQEARLLSGSLGGERISRRASLQTRSSRKDRYRSHGLTASEIRYGLLFGKPLPPRPQKRRPLDSANRRAFKISRRQQPAERKITTYAYSMPAERQK